MRTRPHRGQAGVGLKPSPADVAERTPAPRRARVVEHPPTHRRHAEASQDLTPTTLAHLHGGPGDARWRENRTGRNAERLHVTRAAGGAAANRRFALDRPGPGSYSLRKQAQ